MYRSEPMSLCQLFVQNDAAYACVAELGKTGCVQFKDLNEGINEFQRRFANDIRRCAEMERSLRYLESRITESNAGIEITPLDERTIDVDDERGNMALEQRILEVEKEVRHHFKSDFAMRKTYSEYVEFLHVLQKTEEFFNVHLDNRAMTELEATEIGALSEKAPLVHDDIGAWFVSGTVPWEKRLVFERVLWRACRRSAFVRHAEIEEALDDPLTSNLCKKCVFIVFFKGECLKNIVNKVCDGFNAKQYPCPKTSRERQGMTSDITTRMNELRLVIESTQLQRYKVLKHTAENLTRWQKQVCLRKAIYQALNMFTFKAERKFFVMECWVPVKELKCVRAALDAGVEKSNSTVRPVINLLETTEEAPTYQITNKFTEVFQSIVDAYGVASYREINPAPFTIITFPFLFAMMFGDFAHGLLMFFFALFFVINERKIESKKIKDEIFNIFYDGRYVILLMGLFSVYTGLVYNDIFAKSLNIFGTAWRNPYNRRAIDKWIEESQTTSKPMLMTFDPKVAYVEQKPYLFGVDPIWNVAENRLTFLNSMKMKTSVIVGIAQMVFGILLSFCNFWKFQSYIDIFTNFIPQMVFILSIFAYLCLQIILKWIYFSVHSGVIFGQFYPGPFCAPSLLVGVVNMFMLKERPARFMKDENSTTIVDRCSLAQWYPQQYVVETILLFCAFLCIPIMLVGKPLYLLVFSARKEGKSEAMNEHAVHIDMNEEELILLTEPGYKNTDNFQRSVVKNSEDKTDVIVHQAIHTIEFALGCISHTASYLRLWALSLAHAQLSDVLWHMVFAQSFHYSGFLGSVIMCICFLIFAILTFSILVLMEGLSAFLHALRLHWVEFQSKFYQGAGHQFVPFSLRDYVKEYVRNIEIASLSDKA